MLKRKRAGLGDAMSVVTKFVNACNRHDADAVYACLHPDFDSIQPMYPSRNFRGADQVRRNWQAIFDAEPGFRLTVLRSATADDTVWLELHGAGRDAEVAGVFVMGIQGDRIRWARIYSALVEPVPAAADDVTAPPAAASTAAPLREVPHPDQAPAPASVGNGEVVEEALIAPVVDIERSGRRRRRAARRGDADQTAVAPPVEAPPVEDPVDVPPVEDAVEAPPVEDAVDVPPVDAPPVEDPVDVPPVEDAVDVPPVADGVEAPPVEAGVEVPPVEAPPVEDPVEAPPVEAPPVEAPPVEDGVEAPPVEAPPVEDVVEAPAETFAVEAEPEPAVVAEPEVAEPSPAPTEAKDGPWVEPRIDTLVEPDAEAPPVPGPEVVAPEPAPEVVTAEEAPPDDPAPEKPSLSEPPRRRFGRKSR